MSNIEPEENCAPLISPRVIPSLPSVTERYFQYKIYLSPKNGSINNNDLLLLVHSNRLVLVTLSPRHDILVGSKTPTAIDYNINNRTNRLENVVRGKSKKGGQKVQRESKICTIECDDGSKYEIRAAVNGKLIQVNRELIEDVSLLTKRTYSNGWIAMILPPFQSNETKSLVDYSQYVENDNK